MPPANPAAIHSRERSAAGRRRARFSLLGQEKDIKNVKIVMRAPSFVKLRFQLR
ncbi:protein of unknown function [Candidatus Hydrogenisulfobacillus filiaventi]|uniref:Uncharacterized protein n=1 Tax=Candidatus Hydrogenisulfobacillus filiaventi TaxID=2707344 RepID=A0A6F8ZFY9_9FIRM|nr:protein of unknown function [Candidatus Hydrogenisulfobacillus filiaventi]